MVSGRRNIKVSDRHGTSGMGGVLLRRRLVVAWLCGIVVWWYMLRLVKIGETIDDDIKRYYDTLFDVGGSTGDGLDDGHWSIGLYRGKSSPLQVQPIDALPWSCDDDAHRAWPISNPVFTTLHIKNEHQKNKESMGRHGKFASDPFLFQATGRIASKLGLHTKQSKRKRGGDNIDRTYETFDHVQDFLEDHLGVRSLQTVGAKDGHTNSVVMEREGLLKSDQSLADGRTNRNEKENLESLVNGPLYLFFQTKNMETRKGDIGVAVSNNGGLTWTYLGIALSSQNSSLSYPYMFQWEDDIYMLPEAKESGELSLYKAELSNFPFEWVKVSTLLTEPVVNPSIVEWNGLWYLFVTDDLERNLASLPRSTAEQIELHVYHADTPLGPWMSHFLNPVMVGNAGSGARMAGRLVKQADKLYRFGQDGTGTYGKDVLAFRIDTLTPKEFVQTRVKFQAGRIRKGTGAWNSQRRHHVDLTQLSDGSWLGVLDGDYSKEIDSTKRKTLFASQYYHILLIGLGLIVFAFLKSYKSRFFVVNAWKTNARQGSKKSNDHAQFRSNFFIRASQSVCLGLSVTVCIVFGLSMTLTWSCDRQYYKAIVDASNTTHELRIPIENVFSKYTVIVSPINSKMGLKVRKRKQILSSMIQHYSSCPSTAEVVIGHLIDDKSMIKYFEEKFSPLYRPWIRDISQSTVYDVDGFSIPTRAAVILSPGMFLPCKDIERLFAQWRYHPEVLYGVNTFTRQGETIPDSYNLLSSGLYFLDFNKLVEINSNQSWNRFKSIVGRYDSCDAILLSMMWINTWDGASSDPLMHFDPEMSMNVIRQSNGDAKSKNTCIEELIQEDIGVYQPNNVYRLDVVNKNGNKPSYFCKGPWAFTWKSFGI